MKRFGKLLIGAGVIVLGLMLVGALVGKAFGPRNYSYGPRMGDSYGQYGYGPTQGYGPQESFGPQHGSVPGQGYGPQQSYGPREFRGEGPGFGPRGGPGQFEGWRESHGRGWHRGEHHGPGGFFLFPLLWTGFMTKLALLALLGALIWRSFQLRRQDDGGTPPATNDPSVV